MYKHCSSPFCSNRVLLSGFNLYFPWAPLPSSTGSQISCLSWQWCPGWTLATLCQPKPHMAPFLVMPSVNLIMKSNLSNKKNLSNSGCQVTASCRYWLVFRVFISLMLIVDCCLFLLAWLKLPVFRNWRSESSTSSANNTGKWEIDCDSQLLHSVSTYTATLN